MLLDDPLQHFGGARAIPNGFRVHHGDGSLDAHAQAIDLAAINQRLRPGQVQIFEPALQILPGLQTLFLRRAMRFGLVGAQENVPPVFFQAQALDDRCQLARHGNQVNHR